MHITSFIVFCTVVNETFHQCVMLRKLRATFGTPKSSKAKSACDTLKCCDESNASSFVSRAVTRFPHVHGASPVSAVLFSPGDMCLSGGQDCCLVLSDIGTGTVIQRWAGHSKEITKVTYEPKHAIYISASRDKTVNMWKRCSFAPVHQFVGHELVVTGVTVNISGTLLCTGSRDNTVRLWDIETGACTKSTMLAQNVVTDVRWDSTKDVVVQSGEDKMLHVWDIRNLQPVISTTPKQYIQTSCDITDDGRYCISTSNGFSGNGCEATLWDLRSARQPVREYRGHTETVNSCCFLASQPSAIVTCSKDTTIRIWSRDDSETKCLVCFPNSGSLTSVCSDLDCRLLISSIGLGIQLLSVLISDNTVYTEKIAEF